MPSSTIEIYMQWATIASPIIGVIAIIISLCIACNSSKSAQKQINAVYKLLEVFIASKNLDISEALQKYEELLSKNDSNIRMAKLAIGINYEIKCETDVDKIEVTPDKMQHKIALKTFLNERKELKENISLIEDYIHKAKK